MNALFKDPSAWIIFAGGVITGIALLHFSKKIVDDLIVWNKKDRDKAEIPVITKRGNWQRMWVCHCRKHLVDPVGHECFTNSAPQMACPSCGCLNWSLEVGRKVWKQRGEGGASSWDIRWERHTACTAEPKEADHA